ncbi:hypothetical protein ABZS66_37400 [Dactylosporangium sp. NPDC005572]|uniref:hypothetical protein n=1 Tax=Dactylosporangium sp. NPDC005572 TaxID=3156889 RepID=UPI0033B83A98
MNYRDDPRWLAAQENYVADKASDESGDQALVRRINAAMEMFAIESAVGLPLDAEAAA